MPVTLYATLRPKRTPEQPDPTETVEVAATGEDYYAARGAIRAQIPEGWQALGVSTWPCKDLPESQRR